MSWAQIVSAISADYVSRLAIEGLPPLVEGAIQFGPQHLFEHAAPPRVAFVPKGSKFRIVAPADRNVATPTSAEHRAMLASRVRYCETKIFHVRVWGVQYVAGAPVSDSDADWDYCESMYQILIGQSFYTLLAGRYRVTSGVWVDSLPQSSKLDVMGRMFDFELEVDTPILDHVLPIPFVPSGSTTATIGVGFAGGSAADTITLHTPPK